MKGYSYYNSITREYSLCAILSEANGLYEVIDLHSGEFYTLTIECFIR